MKKIAEFLKQLNFSETETKLYMILLQRGSMTVSELAQKAQINRTAAYGHINALLEKGVILQSYGSSNKFAANPPSHLYYLVDQKISAAKQLEERLSPIVNLLNTSFMQSQNVADSKIKHYKGRTGIRAIYDDCLKSNKIRSYFNPKEIQVLLPENTGLFEHALAANKKMEIFEIVEDSVLSRKGAEEVFRSPRHYWKFLPKDVKLTSNDILIYDGKVAIVNLIDEENFTGFILQNKDYYNNSVQLFDLLWRLLPTSSRT